VPDQVDVHASDEKNDVSLPHGNHAPGGVREGQSTYHILGINRSDQQIPCSERCVSYLLSSVCDLSRSAAVETADPHTGWDLGRYGP
jgi:hypothetical protein